ncbi:MULTISPECIES: maleylacetoacetate isomerase [unclassified Sphingomonas]|uniref:maleylacetoacetate isomerase n=1 Tax=unclassified Sphingomonas TaxID=196159 RepID=UPI002151058D|nr:MULTISPECIES: maleylacetoacetate isomerase [unclassified Sphingomonas]MCR5870325.1 maleylacetoacetate isomerase [Sphingomonas sp. J344]UUX97989.1 maleylacetoacetate isomerase [Sphingomonas sp. J315]
MILYDYFRSSAAYRVRIALNLKDVPHERREVHLVEGAQRSDAHLARNPQGFVPALDIGGGRILTQSLAIIEWLDATYPQPRLIPVDPLARADAMAQALLIAADIHPLNNLRVLKALEARFSADEGGKADWYRHWIVEGFTALEATARAGPFLGGTAPGIADVMLVPQMYNARRFDVPLDAFPTLLAADAAACGLDAFVAASPERAKPA